MVTLVWETDIQKWVEATRPVDWYGKCAGLTDRVVAAFTGGSRQWYDSATDARRASGTLNTDPAACPPGGIHFWSYYGTAWDGSRGDWGHVTIDIRGGGTATLSATGHAFEYWGVNAGLISVESQSARAGMRYLGWARTYGAAAPLTITTESTAGDNARPFEEDDMPLLPDERDALFAVKAILTDGTPQDLSTGRLQQMYDSVKNIESRIYIRDANGTPVWDVFQELIPNVRLILNMLGNASGEHGTPIDVKALASAISESLSPEVGKALVAELGKQLTK
jgi:hypothetical protein